MLPAKAVLFVMTGVGMGVLIGCDRGTPPAPAPTKPAPKAWVEPLTMGPITYFNTMCSSCHGPYGTQIVDHNIARSTGSISEYRSMVQYMVTERASSSLPPRDLDAQTSYCMSLAAASGGGDADTAVETVGNPLFVCVKAPLAEGGLEGEVTPGCSVTLITGKGQVRIDAAVTGHAWAITPQQVSNAKQSAGDDWVNAVIEARKAGAGGKPQTLRLSEEAFVGPTLKKK